MVEIGAEVVASNLAVLEARPLGVVVVLAIRGGHAQAVRNTDGDEVTSDRAYVSLAGVHVADITYPDGSQSPLALAEQGLGAFEAALTGSQPGVYRFLVSAAGFSYRGASFTREHLMTVVLGESRQPGEGPWEGGGASPPEGLCTILSCLLNSGAIDEGHLKELGLDVMLLRRCFAELCEPSQGPSIR